MELYRHLHAHPELSTTEQATAARIAEEFNRLGFQVQTGIGGHGVAALLANGPGPVILLRADMDALPVEENTGLPYASRVRVSTPTGQSLPVMHACGHDIHMTVLVGTAELLATHRKNWSGTLIAIGQPAEEKMNGAQAMLSDGLYQRIPRPDFALSLHVAPTLPADTVGICPGYAWACADQVQITVLGVGGHGATPHKTRDPIVLSAQLILALQTIVSREIDPTDPAVISIGTLHGGSAFNIIPDEVRITLTLRTYAPEVRDTLIAAIRRQAHGLGLAAGLPEDRLPVVTVNPAFCPAVYNDPDLTARIGASFRRVLGEQKVVAVKPEMVGEDFGLFGRVTPSIPLSIFRLGIRPTHSDAPFPPLHSPQMAPVADLAIPTGVSALSAAVIDLLPPA
jgi:hippurate hydrolase